MRTRWAPASAVFASLVLGGCGGGKTGKSDGTIIGDAGPGPEQNDAMPPQAGGEMPRAGTNSGDTGGTGDMGGGGTGDMGGGGTGGVGGKPFSCAPLCGPTPMSLEPAPARAIATDETRPNVGRVVYTRELHSRVLTYCGSGSCHGTLVNSDFVVPANPLTNDQKFVAALATKRYGASDQEPYDWMDDIEAYITEDNPKDDEDVMPPLNSPGGQAWPRSPGDPIYELLSLLKAWDAAGKPADSFRMPDADEPAPDWCISQEVSKQLTNIGSCLPKASSLGSDVDAMKEMDARFASYQKLEDLPRTLHETDVVSYDSGTLARTGVVSYAPTYPLFSDDTYEATNAYPYDPDKAKQLGAHSLRKIRYVRVPYGRTIDFNVDTQEFAIPDNTRFYKTFLKKVIDADGNEHYRKIETRLIVARADGPDLPDGSHETHALYATYAWNDNETQATLVLDPQRNGKPFLDRVVTYVTDERLEQKILKTNPRVPVNALLQGGAMRSYAIPGAERCVQCHEGSATKAFVLGFIPLQIARRKSGEGGIYDPPGPDELDQVRRLIDYGVISGIDSADGVVPLEESQLPRMPRNDYELAAQAYMLGNCAGCHNPRGYATIRNPQLISALNMYPDRHGGGVFQFPFDRTSPRITRDGKPMAYLSSDLINPNLAPIDALDDGSRWEYLAAPWQSLLYRVVDTPFLSTMDGFLLPHMPLNAPGFDRRAPRIMGDWALSIPSRASDQSESGYIEVKPGDKDYDSAAQAANQRLHWYHEGGPAWDPGRGDQGSAATSEAMAGNGGASSGNEAGSSGNGGGGTGAESAGTAAAGTGAESGGTGSGPADKSNFYYSAARYNDYAPNTSDIIYTPPNSTTVVPPDDSALPTLQQYYFRYPAPANDPAVNKLAVGSGDRTPDAPYWVVTDFTDFQGDWEPRRVDWKDVIVDRALSDEMQATEKDALTVLWSLSVSSDDAKVFRDFATTKVPVGRWQMKDKCDYSHEPKASQFKGERQPRWFTETGVAPPDDTPIYMQTPGAAVYNRICINCHGPKFDSQGRIADNLMLITGGRTRVANFADGLFKPAVDGSPRSNIDRVFGMAAHGQTADNLAARYFAWMALGGTRSVIDDSLLQVIATSDVLGVTPDPNGFTNPDANMLGVARLLCRAVLGVGRPTSDTAAFRTAVLDTRSWRPVLKGLVHENGDAEMWMSLCNQPFVNGKDDIGQPIRVFVPYAEADGRIVLESWNHAGSVFSAPLRLSSTYPPNSPLGDQLGRLRDGLTADNLFPWCIRPPKFDFERDSLRNLEDDRAQKGLPPLPMCPQSWLALNSNLYPEDEYDARPLRGAVAAGFAAFLYLKDAVAKFVENGKDPMALPPNYNECPR